MKRTKTQAFVALTIILLIAAAVVWAASHHGQQFLGVPVFLICAIVAFAVNWAAFIPANKAQSERYYDLTGSLTYLSVVIIAFLLSSNSDLRSVLAMLLVIVWAVRLGSFLYLRIQQDGHDDRFDEIKVAPLRFFLAWTMQGLWVLLTAACALVIITNQHSQPISVLGVLGLIIWGIGFALEVVADRQKRAFKRDSNNKGRFINVGLWSWSQHPNYFGEILIWVGMAVLALPVMQGWQFVALISPLFVAFLLIKVSGIPLLQKKAKIKWGDDPSYQRYVESTSLLIPLPPKK